MRFHTKTHWCGRGLKQLFTSCSIGESGRLLPSRELLCIIIKQCSTLWKKIAITNATFAKMGCQVNIFLFKHFISRG